MATRAAIAAVSGIDAEQSYLDEVGANISNANTVGYKQGQVVFGTLLSEQLSGATAPAGAAGGSTGASAATTASGGVNPLAIGSGVRVVAVAPDLAEGTLENTGSATDVAITGAGYLVVEQGGQQLYTRDGALTVDGNGELTTLSGAKVLGWQAAATGKITTNSSVGAITIPYDKTIAATATSTIDVAGNLPSWKGGATTVPTYTLRVTAYDALGEPVPVIVTFTGDTAANTWKMSAVAKTPASGTTKKLFTTVKVTFGPTGELKKVKTAGPGASGFTVAVAATKLPTGFTALSVHFPLATADQSVTQYAGSESLVLTQNGHAAGSLISYNIGSDGVITGTFSNGTTTPIGEIALASFSNPAGLSDVGNNLLDTTANSGQPSIGVAGTGVRGTLLGGELEQSNVTLAQQLTDLITAQQAYEANTKVISTMQQTDSALMQA